MERWLARLAQFVFRRRVLVLVASALVVLAAAMTIARGGRLSSGDTEGLESERAKRVLEQELGVAGDASFTVLLSPRPGLAESERIPALSEALAPLREDPRVRSVLAPDALPPAIASKMISPGGDALAVVTMRDGFREAAAQYPELKRQVRDDRYEARFTGNLAFRHDLDEVLERDLLRAELVSLPLAVLVLLLVFRSAVAAVLPVCVGGLAVATGIAGIVALSRVTDVAVYAINIASLIGLGVAIDYSLFLVSRYRDELARGASTEDAIVRATQTAGKAVAFAGLAVGIGLGSLLFFRGSFLATMGLAAAIVVALAVVFALTTLPALLAVIGPKIDAWRVPLPELGSPGTWHRIARFVMRRPIAILVPTLAVLVLLGTPFVRLRMAAADVSTLPRGVEARETYEAIRARFPEQTRTRIDVIARFPTAPAITPSRIGALHDLSRRLGAIPGVVGVESIVDLDPHSPPASKEQVQALWSMPPEQLPPEARFLAASTVGRDLVTLSVLTDAKPASDEARAIVRAIREQRGVADGTLAVTGATAHDVDVTEFILGRAPWAVAFVIAMTIVTLYLLLRSVVLPLKAVVMNFLSITASFGALVWIFQEGHLAGVLGFEPRPLDPTLPVLLFCALFGLSMDYEVLMLSRMKEEHDRTGDNAHAVAEGLEKTGRLVTSAAAIMVTVFAAFSVASVVVVKAMGVAMAIAVALDATVVRILIVPSTMRLFGELNWWAPRLSRRGVVSRAPLLRGSRTSSVSRTSAEHG